MQPSGPGELVMRVTLALGPRLIAVALLALVCPHPVSFREGGYLPVAVIVTILGDEPVGGLLMLGFCLLLYGVPLFALSFLLFRHRSGGHAG
jgi:hypothetical protein